MAVDDALLDGLAPGYAYTLRLYGWRRPTVSLGYAQPWAEGYDPRVARRLGIDLVRRTTGGRAVLHSVDELTYSMSAPSDDGRLAGGIHATYRLLAEGLAGGLRELGADVAVQRSGQTTGSPGSLGTERGDDDDRVDDGFRDRPGACFAVRARFELVAGDGLEPSKLLGSAQRRRRRRLMQHGSLPLGQPDGRLWGALGPSGEAAVGASIGLAQVLGRGVSRRQATAAIVRGISSALRLEARVGALSALEMRRVRHYERLFADPDFTFRR